MFSLLSQYIDSLDINSISLDRKEALDELVKYIDERKKNQQVVRLNFVCTHNSRRSHLSQIWAQSMAHFYQVKDVYCYSSGTEATAIYPSVIKTLENAGFELSYIHRNDENPVYSIKFDPNEAAIVGFSKTLEHAFNPKTDFAAIMTCAQADEACPFVAGANARIPIRYEDPKRFDNTEIALEKYAERSRQIAIEMAYVFQAIHNLHPSTNH